MKTSVDDLYTPHRRSNARPQPIETHGGNSGVFWNRFDAGIGRITRFGGLAAALYIFGGELVLPDHIKFSTILGQRIGNTRGETVITQAPDQASAMRITQSESIRLRSAEICLTTREQKKQSVYDSCMSTIGRTSSCELRAMLAINGHCQEFDDILPADGGRYMPTETDE